MADLTDFQALGLIDKAVLAIQARQGPGRPLFYAMERLRSEIRKARNEALFCRPVSFGPHGAAD